MGYLRTTQPSVVTGGRGILLGLAVPAYYQGYSPVLNWAKIAEAPTVYATVTFTGGGSPNIVRTAHGLAVDNVVAFANTGGALPAALNAGTGYWVKTVVDANTFTVSPYGGAAINMATSGTGTHSVGGDGIIAWNAALLDPATGEIKPSIGVTKRVDLFFTHPIDAQRTAGANFALEPWVAEWDGTGTGSIGNLEAGGGQDNTTFTNKITFTMGTPQDNGVILTLTVTNQADPPRNIRIYQSRYATNVTNGELTNPDWRAEMAKFPTLRFMDWQATNNSKIINFSELATEAYYRWGRQLNYSSDASSANTTPNGPKGGVHPSIICKVLNETGCKGHVNIPTNFTDAAVLEFVNYMKANTTKHVTYEYSNEIFHGGFYQYGYAQAQADLIPAWSLATGDNSATSEKWYGYRSAQVMKIVRDAYGDTSRWAGAITSMAVNTDKMMLALSGVAYWKSSTASALNVSDLFRATYYAPYYGSCTDGVGNAYGRYITAINNASPAKVTSADAHGRTTGDRIKIFIRGGMTELNNTFATVTVVNTTEFTLNGVNSIGYAAYAADNNYWVPAALWDLMDASDALYPGTNPSPYTYFNAQYKIACMTGTCAQPGVVHPYPLPFFQAVWVDQKTLATNNGLEMRQYEGGNHFVGGGPVTQYGGEPQLNRFVAQWGHCQESVDVQSAYCAAWNALGGFETAKFQEGGGISQFGCWAGIRYWPTVANGGTTDTNNPLWQVITYYNEH